MVFMRKENFDRMWVGTVLGIAVPFVSLLIYQALKFDSLSFVEFLRSYFRMGILSHVISLAVIPNLIVFFLFIHTDLLKSARGVLLATFLFAFTVLLLRFT